MPGVWGVWDASSPGTAAATVVLTASVLTAGSELMVAMVDFGFGTFAKARHLGTPYAQQGRSDPSARFRPALPGLNYP